MKNIKIQFQIPAFLLLFLMISSCDKGQELETTVSAEISEETLQKVASLGMNPNGIKNYDLERPDGTRESGYLISGDIHMTPAQLERLDPEAGITTEHYRYVNLVSQPRTITVTGYTGGSFALTTKMRTALSWALNNYNAINLTLRFVLTFGTSTTSDIVVYKNPNISTAGGTSGTPSAGDPYKWVQIYSGTDAFSTNVIEYFMTHEIGHCIGMAHTDWRNRESCGGTGGSPFNPGFVYIPGTPTGFDPGSIFNTCVDSGTQGEFNANDILALQVVY
ncbi:M57 family metalloprotease [Flavobacteriaceae bacterium M23B6Z8]